MAHEPKRAKSGAESSHKQAGVEAIAMGKALEPLAKAEAKERQGTRTDKHPGNLPEGSTGESRDAIAAAVGMKPRTYEKNTPGNLPEVSGEAREQVAAAVGMKPRTYEKAKAADRQAGEGADAFWEVGGP